MAQTLVSLYIHVIFSTKNRSALIKAEIEKELFAYIGGIIKNNNSRLIAANGTGNHVHLLISMGKMINLSELVGDVKRDSSKWLKTKGYRRFQWQDGYGGFSVGQNQIEDVKKYIVHQKEHHAKKSFEDEYRQFLVKYGIDFDENFVWG
jgi:REP element-mobilizing transposase RayT